MIECQIHKQNSDYQCRFRGFPYSNLSGKKVFFAMLVVGLIVLSIFVRGPHTTHEGGSDARNYTSFHDEMDVEYDPENGRKSLYY